MKQFLNGSFRSDYVFLALIALYGILLVFQLNLPPFERYPGWDHFWIDVRTAGSLVTLKQALINFELPAISPYHEFGWNYLGNTSTVPFLSPLSLLILVFKPGVAMMLYAIAAFILGGIGGYLYLKLVTRDRFISFLGGLTYISIPFVINMHFYGTLIVFLIIPLLLYMIHRILDNPSWANYLVFVAFSILAFTSGDVYALIILPTVVAGYSFLVAYGYYRLRLHAVKPAVFLTVLCILSASFFIVPLYNNLHEISNALRSLTAAGLYTAEGRMSLQGFLSFLSLEGGETLYRPIEGSALLLYAPAFLYFGIVIAIAFWPVVFKQNPRRILIPASLLLLGLAMFLISLLYYLLPPGINQMGRGVLRYQLNLIPFVVVLAGFVCFAEINNSKKLKVPMYILIILGSIFVDIVLFKGNFPPSLHPSLFELSHVALEGTRASNLMSVRFISDMWLFLPWLNLAFSVILFSYSSVRDLKREHIRKTLYVLLVICAMFLPLLNMSVHNELRATQQQAWQRLERNSYLWDSYVSRRACINTIIVQYDKNYRTLPASKDIINVGRGRSWKMIAETELHVQDEQKMLFSYRETMHPYAGLLYSTFAGGLRLSNWFPPVSQQVIGNIDTVRLMGVRWVISADAMIDSPDLIYRGECITQEEPPGFPGPGKAGGLVYVYEVKNPIGIAFLVNEYQVVDYLDSLKVMLQNKERPWTKNIVYIEEEPVEVKGPADASAHISSDKLSGSSAEIVKESFNSIEIKTNTPAGKFLVLSYLYRPGWKAYVGSEPLKIYRAYGGFMAVEVPLGNSIVSFKYTPVDVYLGLLLTVFSFMLPVVVHRVSLYRKRRAKP